MVSNKRIDNNPIAESNRLKNIFSDIKQRPVTDPRFTNVNHSGHTTILPATKGDVNDSGNANFIMPATATTLELVSTSLEDGAGTFTGVLAIFIDGLDQNFNILQEVIALNGTSVVTTTGSYRTINRSIAVAGGIPGSGAVGVITISATTGGQIFGKYIVDDTSSEVGRYTVPSGYRLLITATLYNGGDGGDMTITGELTLPGAYPISLSDFYVGSQFDNTGGLSFFYLEAGSMFKFRGFTNSGSPATRKLSAVIIGIQAKIEDWNSIQL